jgi:hypothetical protein
VPHFREPIQDARNPARRRSRLAAIAILLLLLIAAGYWGSRLEWAKASLAKARALIPLRERPLPMAANDEMRSPVATNSMRALPGRGISPVGVDDYQTLFAEIFKGKMPEICGLTADEAKTYINTNGDSVAHLPMPSFNAALDKLLRSDKAEERLVGFYVRAYEAGETAMKAEKVNYPGCKRDSGCWDATYKAKQEAQASAAEPLVQWALSSGDAKIYAAALYACGAVKAGACSSVSYAGWAQLEPENASVWLLIASDAERRKDVAARTAALDRAAAARDYNPRVPNVAAIFNADSVRAESPLVQSLVASKLMMVDSGLPRLSWASGIGRHCGRAEAMGDTRRVLCDQLATKIAEKDETLMGLRLAQSAGERAGWDAARVQRLKDEYTIFLMPLSQLSFDEKMLTCESLNTINAWTAKLLTVGERAIAREMVRTSGKSLAELAEEYRKTVSDGAK